MSSVTNALSRARLTTWASSHPRRAACGTLRQDEKNGVKVTAVCPSIVALLPAGAFLHQARLETTTNPEQGHCPASLTHERKYKTTNLTTLRFHDFDPYLPVSGLRLNTQLTLAPRLTVPVTHPQYPSN
jgi:hypothetical protein